MSTAVHSGAYVQKARLIAQDELPQLFRTPSPAPRLDGKALRDFCSRLHDELSALYPDILEATRSETAFTRPDCEEAVSSSLEYVRGFPDYLAGLPREETPPQIYRDDRGERQIELRDVPWGTVAVILPQSAFLILSLTCLLNALATGNRVILRVPAQSMRSGELLSLAIDGANPPPDSVYVVLAQGRAFVQALCESRQPILLHYLGSSAHAPEILSDCFRAGKHAIIDGEGNAWVWVDEDVPPDRACDLLTSGALRYNGQTCTSVNGAVIHPGVYDRLKERLVARWSEITFGNPPAEDVQVGPVMSEEQAEQCLSRINAGGGKVLVGGCRDGNLLAPTLIAEPAEESDLVSDGLFGPALWIAPGDMDFFARLWQTNRYPLCAGILSANPDHVEHLRELPGLARLVINGDPSLEHIYEPWGGYPASGTNPVGPWHRKYLRTLQLDRPVPPR